MLATPPRFARLDDDDVRAILARNHVGRLAFVVDGEVDIRPLHYVYSQGAIYCRTTPASRLSTVPARARVAFEVDEVESVFEWKSVIARGTCRPLLSSDEADAEEWGRAAELLRLVVKHALAEGDPVPARSVILKIGVEEATGMGSWVTAGKR